MLAACSGIRMATAGDRYSEITGNIWSYAKRGDLTGVKAAILRNVSVDAVNTAGWTPLHAAASGGQIQVMRLLLKMRADVSVRDRGGNLAAHEAARGGQLQCLEVLREAGVDLSEIRLSQTKGAAVHALVAKATRDAAKRLTGTDEAEEPVVGYARQKQKSCAFWGPRRTPISTKIKREILKKKRQTLEDQDVSADVGQTVREDTQEAAESQCEADPPAEVCVEESLDAPVRQTYLETVQRVKRNERSARRSRKTAAHAKSAVSCEAQIQEESLDAGQDGDYVQAYSSGAPAKVCERSAVANFSALLGTSDDEASTDSSPR